MKQCLGIIALVIWVAFAHPVKADIFAITLIDVNGVTVDGTGSFTHAPTDSGSFSNFTVTWDSILFDFTHVANTVPSVMHGCDGNISISVFTYLTNPDCQEDPRSPQHGPANHRSRRSAFSHHPKTDSTRSAMEMASDYSKTALSP